MNRETSLYLDAVRFAAAMTVFLGHQASREATGGFLWQLKPFGPDAVLVFFVLSGFVIGYVTFSREREARTYGVSRASRIYSVALPALVLTALLDGIGQSLAPDRYAAIWHIPPYVQALRYVGALFFLNEIWFVSNTPGTNDAYWSLGYEVWYYAIFGLFMFAPLKWRWLVATATLLFVGPKIAAMFPAWLLGVGCYRLCAAGGVGRRLGLLLFLGGLGGWVGVKIWSIEQALVIHLPMQPYVHDLAHNYAVCICFAAHLLGFHGMSPVIGRLLAPLGRPVRWLAGRTFSVYLYHMPISRLLMSVNPWTPASWATRIFLTCGTLAVVCLLAEFTERCKDTARRIFANLLHRLAPEKKVLM